MNSYAIGIVLTVLLVGCQSQMPDLLTDKKLSTKAQPALLANANQANLEQIKLIIAEALGTDSVYLSQSAFKNNSLLIIERQPARFLDKPALLSETELPNHFMLLKSSQACLIEHRQSQRQWIMENIDCVVSNRKNESI